jgi:hypothetical protein
MQALPPLQRLFAMHVCWSSIAVLVQEFFDTHEADAHALKHDKQLTKHAHKVKHLRQMPDYLKASAGVATAALRRRLQTGRGVKRKLRVEDDPIKVSQQLPTCTSLPSTLTKLLSSIWSRIDCPVLQMHCFGRCVLLQV